MTVDLDNPRPECADYHRLLESALEQRDEWQREAQRLRADVATLIAEACDARERGELRFATTKRAVKRMNELRQERDAARAEARAAQDAESYLREKCARIAGERDFQVSCALLMQQERDAAIARVRELETTLAEIDVLRSVHEQSIVERMAQHFERLADEWEAKRLGGNDAAMLRLCAKDARSHAWRATEVAK